MVLEVVRAMVRAVRPWKLPWKTMTLGRPVAWRASLTAPSTASAPLLERKKQSNPSGTIVRSSFASSSNGWWKMMLACPCRSFAACSWMAWTTFGWQWPVLVTPMPEVKSR